MVDHLNLMMQRIGLNGRCDPASAPRDSKTR